MTRCARCLNCLSAGSVSLTAGMVELARKCRAKSQLPFGWVCFSNPGPIPEDAEIETSPSQLPFGWVCFSNVVLRREKNVAGARLNCLSAGSVSLTWISRSRVDTSAPSQLPFGWVCFSNGEHEATIVTVVGEHVSIAFRLGLFL